MSILSFLFWKGLAFIVFPCFLGFISLIFYGIISHYIFVSPIVKKAQEIHYGTKDPDSIVKNGFSSQKLHKLGKIDAVVIGSGMGGLSTAVLLARRGKKVVVLEQHDVAGGCTHTFTTTRNIPSDGKISSDTKKHLKYGNYEYDTGVHYVGGDVGDKYAPLGFVFHLLSGGFLKWGKLNKDYDTAAISEVLATQLGALPYEMDKDANTSSTLPPYGMYKFSDCSDREYIDKMCEYFPDVSRETHADINRLYRWAELFMGIWGALKVIPLGIANIIRKVTDPFILPLIGASTWDILSNCTDNEHMKGVITYCYGDYGLPPKESSFLLHATLATHFRTGAFYPVGGASEMAKTMIPTIMAAGGAVFVRAPVTEIILNKDMNAVTGVRVRGVEIQCSTVISAAGLINTYHRLLCPITDAHSNIGSGSAHIDRVRRHIKRRPAYVTKKQENYATLEPSCAMFTLYVGCNRSPKELGVTTQNKWLFPSWTHDKSMKIFTDTVTSTETADADHISSAFLPCAFISSASAKDSKWTQRHGNRKCVFELVTMSDYESFRGLETNHRKSIPENRGDKYEKAKIAIQNKLLQVLYEQYPQLEEQLKSNEHRSGSEADAFEMEVFGGTPLTNAFYLNTCAGEIYGLAHSTDRYSGELEWLLRPKQEGISGLYISGQDVVGAGIAGATCGGVMCAIAMQPMVLLDLIISYLFIKD